MANMPFINSKTHPMPHEHSCTIDGSHMLIRNIGGILRRPDQRLIPLIDFIYIYIYHY